MFLRNVEKGREQERRLVEQSDAALSISTEGK
jgi:hypothetical protein